MGNTAKNRSKKNLLNLEEILNSSDPVIRNYFEQTYIAEMHIAQERAVLQVGLKFKNMLSGHQQSLLMKEAQAQGLAI